MSHQVRRPEDAPQLYAIEGGGEPGEVRSQVTRGPVPEEGTGRDLAVPTTDEIATHSTTEIELADDAVDGVVLFERELPPLPPLLPAWASSPAHLKAYAKVRVHRAGHKALFHGIRTPKYLIRVVVRGLIGSVRGLKALAGWVFHWEARPLRQAAVAGTEYREYLALVQVRNDYVRIRGIVAGGAILVTVVASIVEVFVFPIGLAAEGAAGLAIAAWWGGPDVENGLLDRPDLPVRLELTEQHLNSAFRAATLLKGKDDDEDAPRLLVVRPPMRDQSGWSAVLDLPRGGGKTAKDALAKRDVIAAELGVDEIQLDLRRVRAVHGGHAGRISLWVCDDDPYIQDLPTPSPLAEMTEFDMWQPVPFGRDARGNRVDLPLMWQSMFFGGLPRRGKTASQRIPAAAAALDARVKHFVADGKGGGDWLPMRQLAHRLVLGAETDAVAALEAMLDEVIDEMENAYRILRKIPASIAPDAKLTPQIQKRYGLQLTFVTIDELQEYLTAISDNKRREALIDRLCRISRRGPAAGFFSNFASQRPDADSVPTRLREIVSYRYCTQVIDRASSDMVLGKGKASQGADASILSEEHVGVGVLVTGPANFTIVKADYLDLPSFTAICARGRQLREQAGTLTGDAADEILARADVEAIPQVLSDALTLLRHTDRIHSYDLLNRLVNVDEDSYGNWSVDRLAEALDVAGVERTTRQVKINGRNLNGYHRSDLEAAAELYERPS